MTEPVGPADLRMGTPAARWVLLTTVLGSGVVMLDGTVVNVALERIGADLGASFGGLQWTVNAYTLTLASLILLGGSLGDRFGRRRVFVIGVVWFAVASLLCGSAPNLRAARRGPGPAGRRRRAADPGQPGADLRVVPRPGPGRGDRRLVGAGRDRRSGRPVRRRLAGRVDLAGGVPDQPAAGGAGGRRRAPARAGVPGPRGGTRSGHLGHGARGGGAGGADLVADRPRRGRCGRGAAGRAGGGAGRARRVRRRRAPVAAPAGAAAAVRRPPVHARRTW